MRRLSQGDIVAVHLPSGPRWLDILHEGWAAGAAVLPVDVRLPAPAQVVAFARPTHLLDGDGVRALRGGEPTDGEIALVVPTSGTTADPKLAELTFDAVRAQIGASNEALGASPKDRWLCCLPLVHVGGLLVAMRAVVAGAPVEVHERFDVDAVHSSDARYVSVVPTMLHRLVEAGAEDLSGFQAVLVGGASLAEGLAARATELGARLVRTYGMTETCGGVVYDGTPLPGVEVRIAAHDEIMLRTRSVMRGYRGRAVQPLTSDGWLRTADAGVLEHGSLRVHGRLDDAIVTGGEKVWPLEVERALRAVAGVDDTLVVGVPDSEWGERVVALVVGEADPEDVRVSCRRTLPRYAVPTRVIVVDEIPRTPLGKPSYRCALEIASRA